MRWKVAVLTHRRRRGGLRGELLLVIPPTVTVLVALGMVTAFQRQPVLFASLASSAFLIYLDPRHPMNNARIVASAHLFGVACGILAALILGAGLFAGGVAMAATIFLLVLLDVVHPPAIATALGFAFFQQEDQAVVFFLLALAMLIALVVLQWIALRLLNRIEGKPEPPAPPLPPLSPPKGKGDASVR